MPSPRSPSNCEARIPRHAAAARGLQFESRGSKLAARGLRLDALRCNKNAPLVARG